MRNTFYFTLLLLLLNPRIALGDKKKPKLSFWLSKKFLFIVGRCPFVTFPEYEMGWVQNATIMSPIVAPERVWHNVKHVWIFWNCEILWSCWLVWQSRSRISMVVIQVTKSNFPSTATSNKVSPNDCDNDRQPEIAIWPQKPEILTSLELW